MYRLDSCNIETLRITILRWIREIVPSIKSIKPAIAKFLGLRCELDMSAAVAKSADSCQFTNVGLSAGWYMIEAKSDNQAIGSFLDIRTFSDANCLHQSGAQTLQLTNTRTTKRVLMVQCDSQSLSVSSSTAQDLTELPSIVLVRLSTAFVRKRLIKALLHTAQALQDTTRSQIDCEVLYQWYSDLCPTPDVETSYARIAKASITSLASVITESSVDSNFAIVQVDADIQEQPSDSNFSPYVIITTQDVQASTEFHIVLTSIIEDARENSICLWYTDHDHFTANGCRSHPRLKPASNKGLLRHGNYIGPLVICTRELYDQLGGADTSLTDSAILLFLLKAFDHVTETSIKRIAEIGYSIPITLLRSPHGLYIGENDKLAFEIYQKQQTSSNLRLLDGIYPVTWQLLPAKAKHEPSVDILIATRDRVDLLSQCVESILNITDYSNFTITVADNDSIETETFEYHRKLSQDRRYRKIDCPGEFNYSAINNTAADESNADLLILLNNDTEVHQANWLQKMVDELVDCDVACVGARLLYPNGLLQHAGIVTGLQGVAGHFHQYAPANDDGYSARIRLSSDVSAVTGACLGIRRALYKELGGLDSLNLKVAYNDVDLCLRARNSGYRNRYLADVTLTHHESVSRGTDDDPQKRERFLSEVAYMERVHASWIKNDPAWHPSFSRRHTEPFLLDK